MADTIRQQLFELVIGQLKTIKTSNSYSMYGQTGNYKTDIGERVFAWRAVPFDEEDDDGLIVRDMDEIMQLSSPNGFRIERQLHMQVELGGRGVTSDTDLRNKYIADVEIAIGVGAFTVWNTVGNTRPRKSISIVEQQAEKIAGMIFEFYIDYPTYAFYPYAVSQ
jgi:hypothetical protein